MPRRLTPDIVDSLQDGEIVLLPRPGTGFPVPARVTLLSNWSGISFLTLRCPHGQGQPLSAIARNRAEWYSMEAEHLRVWHSERERDTASYSGWAGARADVLKHALETGLYYLG